MYKIFLAGGFGNNLFQICLGEYLKSKGEVVVYNTTLTKKNWLTKKLRWSTHNDELTQAVINDCLVEDVIGLMDFLFLVREYLKSRFFGIKNYIYNEEKTNTHEGCKRLWGYYAIGNHLNYNNLELFEKVVKTKLSEFPRQINERFCVIHVRKGDFKDDVLLNIEYYRNALCHVDGSLPKVLVTDSYKIKDQFEKELGCKLKIIGDGSVYDDFLILASASVIICSNSTFCYWASVIGDAEIIVHPDSISGSKPWFFSYQNKPSVAERSNFTKL